MLYHPIPEEQARSLLGSPVCAVLKDGSEHIGILSSAANGKLVLNGEAENTGKPAVKNTRPGKTRKSSAAKTKTKTGKAFLNGLDAGPAPLPEWFNPPLPAFGPKDVVELASVELLFPVFP